METSIVLKQMYVILVQYFAVLDRQSLYSEIFQYAEKHSFIDSF